MAVAVDHLRTVGRDIFVCRIVQLPERIRSVLDHLSPVSAHKAEGHFPPVIQYQRFDEMMIHIGGHHADLRIDYDGMFQKLRVSGQITFSVFQRNAQLLPMVMISGVWGHVTNKHYAEIRLRNFCVWVLLRKDALLARHKNYCSAPHSLFSWLKNSLEALEKT